MTTTYHIQHRWISTENWEMALHGHFVSIKHAMKYMSESLAKVSTREYRIAKMETVIEQVWPACTPACTTVKIAKVAAPPKSTISAKGAERLMKALRSSSRISEKVAEEKKSNKPRTCFLGSMQKYDGLYVHQKKRLVATFPMSTEKFLSLQKQGFRKMAPDRCRSWMRTAKTV